MASEVIKLNLIPKGEMPIFHASQFDTGRLITCELYRGEDAYDVPAGYTVELHCRKVDNNIVTMASTLINDNVVTFTSTEQLTACNGSNLCEVAILDEGYRIGTLNFILEVEIDPLKGGITSTSEIHNLESQVEEITTEIIGENYYNKTEVDDLLDAKADASSVYTKSETDTKLALKANTADVYTKSQTDTLLSAKADSSDVYTKGQVDTALSAKADTTYVDAEVDDLETAISAKADASSVYTKSQVDSALALKANETDVYTKNQVNSIILGIMPVDTASGATAEFNTQIVTPLVSVIADVTATGGGGTPVSPVPIVGYSQSVITANDDDVTISFGQTVYGGLLDVTRGKLTVTHEIVDLGSLNYTAGLNGDGTTYTMVSSGLEGLVKPVPDAELANLVCSVYSPITRNQTYNSVVGIAINRYGDLYVYDTNYNTNTSMTAFKTAMNGQMLAYELATPFDIDLTPEVISAVTGANTVSSDTGNIEVKYKTTIQDYLDNHTGG